MTPFERYQKLLASRPTNEEMTHWASIDTLALEKQKQEFDFDLLLRMDLPELQKEKVAHQKWQERHEETKKMIAEYETSKVNKANGHSFEAWKAEFFKTLDVWGKAELPDERLTAWYEDDIHASLAAYRVVDEFFPEEPDPEREAQKKYVAEMTEQLDRADKVHNARKVLVKKEIYEEVGRVGDK